MINIVITWTVLFLVTLAMQTTLIPVFSIAGVVPDLPFIVLYILSIKYGMMPGIYVGFFVGLCQDLYSPSILGQNALAKTVVGFFTGIFNEKLMRTDPLMKFLILLAGFLIHDSIVYYVEYLKNGSQMLSILQLLLTRAIPRTLYSLVPLGLAYVWMHFVKPSPSRL